MLTPAFDFKLDYEVKGGLVTMAKFDGVYPAMAMAITGGKVLIHSPFSSSHEKSSALAGQGLAVAASLAQNIQIDSGQIQILNTNKDIVALESGQLDPKRDNELLLIGSKTNLLAYDVENNSDVFDHEVSDGLNCLAFGRMKGIEAPLVVAGGDCSLTGFDLEAEEMFWTVTGDNARTMEFMNWSNEEGMMELVAGSDDYCIRVFRGAELIFDINESAKIKLIKCIHKNIFGFALENGTYGVYYSRKRLWTQKQSAKVTSIIGMDFGFENELQLVIGFDNGTIEVRKHRSGDLIHQVSLNQSGGKDSDFHIAKLFYTDYRREGKKQLIAVCQNGRVHGFSVSASIRAFQEQVQSEEKIQSNELVEMNKKKIELTNKLSQIEEKKARIEVSAALPEQSKPPTEEQVKVTRHPNIENRTCDLHIDIQKPGWVIRSVILFSDTMFKGGSFAVHPSQASSQVKVPLSQPKNSADTLNIKILLGASMNAPYFLIHNEPSYQVPKFAFIAPLTTEQLVEAHRYAESHVAFQLSGITFSQMEAWIEGAFGFEIESASPCVNKSDTSLLVKMIDVRTHDSLYIHVQKGSDLSSLKVKIMTEEIETAANVVQDMAVNLGLEELVSTAAFGRTNHKLLDILQTVEQSNTLKTHFAANISENIQNVKVFTVRGEASLLIDDIDGMRKNYAQVQAENGALIAEYKKRQLNHEALLASLKGLNALIRQASNLRVGKPNKSLVADARQCVKVNQLGKLREIFEKGAVQ